jgi:hypothetical protein
VKTRESPACQRTAPSCTTYQPVILANAGIQAIGESDDWDEDSRQALVSSECGRMPKIIPDSSALSQG